MNSRELLLASYRAAVAAADPQHIVPPHLPAPPRGRTLVVGAGKAAASMALALERHWPELLPEYERLYGGRAYLPAEVAKPVREQVHALTRAHGVRDRRRVKLRPPEGPEQLRLAV